MKHFDKLWFSEPQVCVPLEFKCFHRCPMVRKAKVWRSKRVLAGLEEQLTADLYDQDGAPCMFLV